MIKPGIFFLFCLVVLTAFASASARAARLPHAHAGFVENQASTQSIKRDVKPAPERYTLSPERRQKAIAYSRARYALYFAGVVISLGIYFLLWRSGVARVFRNWARRASARNFVQCLIFVPLFMLAVSLLEFPLDYYSGFALEHRFDLSTQSFASWLADWGKNFALTTALMVFLIWILYAIIRRTPRRWWFYFWLVTIPITLGIILFQPLVVDPLFFKFTPLNSTQPELVARIEQMLGRAGFEIPRARIFEMDASSKTKSIDAYVTGLGASKRVVIWDTTLEKMTPDEILLVVAHETGQCRQAGGVRAIDLGDSKDIAPGCVCDRARGSVDA